MSSKSKYKIKVTFTAIVTVKAEDEETAVMNAIEEAASKCYYNNGVRIDPEILSNS